MRQSHFTKTEIVRHLILYSGALLLASGVLSLAMQAKIWQYFSAKESCAQFSFRATKAGDDNELPVMADLLDSEDFVPGPFVSECSGCSGFFTSAKQDIPRDLSAFLRPYSFRSPPA